MERAGGESIFNLANKRQDSAKSIKGVDIPKKRREQRKLEDIVESKEMVLMEPGPGADNNHKAEYHIPNTEDRRKHYQASPKIN